MQGLSDFENLYPVDIMHSLTPKALYNTQQPSKRLISPVADGSGRHTPQKQEDGRYLSNSPYLSAFEWESKSLQDSHNEFNHENDMEMMDRIGLQNSPSVGSRDRKLSY